MTRLLASFFRLSLSKGEDIVPVRDELEQVRTYLEIMRLRFDGEILSSFAVEDAILPQKTVKLILQPVVENAILHGLMEKDEPGGLIQVRGVIRDDCILFSVIDDGVGIAPDVLPTLLQGAAGKTKPGGYGLRNVNDRIRLNYGDDYGLRIMSVPGEGTTVEIRLPYRREKPDGNE